MFEQDRKRPRGKSKISRHPLFPATVALWSGAVLALLAVAATPPLPSATKIGVILAVAAIGAAAGFVFARRVAGGAVAPAAQAPAKDSAAEPSLWSQLRDGNLGFGGSDYDEPKVLDIVSAIEPVAPAPVEEPEVAEPELAFAPEPEPAPEPDPGVLAETPPAPIPAPLGTAARRIAEADLETLSQLQLLERLALGLQRRGLQTPALSCDDAADTQTPVVFPGEAERRGGAPSGEAQDPLETEQALRNALAALQRMSGAA